MSNEDRAIELVAQAEKKVKSSQGFLGGLFGGASKLEDAAELYIQAGNAFKMAQKWSGKRNYLTLSPLFERFHFLITIPLSNECYIGLVNSIISGFCSFQAIFHYEQAAQYYRGEESNSSANKCLLKVAMYSAQMGEYAKALEIYEQVAADAIENSLLKYSAKEYFFKATLCHMCIDDVEAQRAVDKYCDMYPAFQDTRECKLLRTLLEAKEEQNTESFTEAIKDYDSISRLDQWLTTILLRIKKGMNEEPDLT
ncbi:PREDICTED: alpha-soluble NSF attachment protein-like [Acropora digitifera]|uniref:alpha-soluble NSF attachment protein-like n=1 Tax=Acropora digitifera TaxID=70779 RepID=UPI00077A46B7|nr:PREDICTED: alpha-soluble NSF attachment protein-like [Acropora digitifera]